jgi:type II secretory pathway pseudopilin PulG
MPLPDDERGPRGLGLVGWVLGVLLVLGAVAVAAVVWFFGFALPGSGRGARRDAEDQTRAVAQAIVRGLQAQAGDGRLTAAEVAEVVGSLPARVVTARLDAGPPTILAELHGTASGPFGPAGATRCYQFTVSTPIGPASRVDATPLASCPR